MGWSTIPKVITAVKALSKTGAKSVDKWKSLALKSKLKLAKENLEQTFKKTDKSLEKLKKTTDRIKWYQKAAKKKRQYSKDYYEGKTKHYYKD